MNRFSRIALGGSSAALSAAAPLQAKSPPPYFSDPAALDHSVEARAESERAQLRAQLKALWSATHDCPIDAKPDFVPQRGGANMFRACAASAWQRSRAGADDRQVIDPQVRLQHLFEASEIPTLRATTGRSCRKPAHQSRVCPCPRLLPPHGRARLPMPSRCSARSAMTCGLTIRRCLP
jgi:hypothetical protein